MYVMNILISCTDAGFKALKQNLQCDDLVINDITAVIFQLLAQDFF